MATLTVESEQQLKDKIVRRNWDAKFSLKVQCRINHKDMRTTNIFFIYNPKWTNYFVNEQKTTLHCKLQLI